MTGGGAVHDDDLDHELDEQPASRLRAAGAAVWRALAAVFDIFDAVVAAGVLVLLVGLWLWFGAGPALTVTGALVVALGIVGQVAANRPAEPDDDGVSAEH